MNRRLVRTLGCLLVLGGLASPVLAAPSAVEGWLSGSGIAPSDVGAVARLVPAADDPARSAGPSILISQNAGQAFNPASVMKLVTTWAALSVMPASYRWRTAVHLRGELIGDVLHGDLILRGGGDPRFLVEDLAALASRLRTAGLRELRGDLVLDIGLFDPGHEDVERSYGEMSQPFNVRPYPLLMNFKSVRVSAQAVGGSAEVQFDPPLAGIPIDNRVRVESGGCQKKPPFVAVQASPLEPRRLLVQGRVVEGCPPTGAWVSVLSHRDYVEALFRAQWRAAGGLWEAGRAREEPGAARGAAWHVHESARDLGEVVQDINKFSNNVMARQLFLQLSALNGGRASADLSRGVVREALRAQGLDFPELVLENGSGLSRDERISAASLGALLVRAAGTPEGDSFRRSLPVVGVDGTMRHRLRGDAVSGRAWIKTGTLNEVRTIAGYVDAASGRRYAVALLVNSPLAARAATVQERFLRWVYLNG